MLRWREGFSCQQHVEEEEEQPTQPADAPTPESSEAAPSEVESAPLSWQEAAELIDQVTGISQRVAQGLLAEKRL